VLPHLIQQEAAKEKVNNCSSSQTTEIELQQIQNLKVLSNSDSPCWFAKNAVSENIYFWLFKNINTGPTGKAEIRRIPTQGKDGQKVNKTPSQ
jgi:hypothetical protein